jgi:hypothetical protein
MINRRSILFSGAGLAAACGLAKSAHAQSPRANASPIGPSPAALSLARKALDRHADAITFKDRIAIADFSLNATKARFHILELASGRARNFLVAHGKGSDPAHTGWLQSFSNTPGSEATSRGAYLTGETYTGQHGLSRRLIGLDGDNSNALSRAIVIHSAWYVSADMAAKGQLGRSQGCFAVSERDLADVMDLLGPGRLLVAVKT